MPGSSGGIDYTSLLLAGGAAGANAVGGYFKSKNDQKNAMAQLQAQIAAKAAADRQSVAADESKLDPFRQQMAQAGDLSKLDRLERGKFTPVKLDFGAGGNKYAANIPNLLGGYSYEKSPELIQSAGTLKRNIMGGNVAPSMTDPNNYGKTAALNLISIAAAGADPATVNFRGGGGPVGAGSVSTGGYGYTPPDPNADLSDGGHSTIGSIGSGAAKGAALGSMVPGLGTLAGMGAGAAVGAIKARTNDTKNQREEFAQTLGFQNTNELWQHLQQALPPTVAAELRTRALNRIGKHDTAANQQWEQDVQAALAASAAGAYSASGGGTPSFTGRG